MNMIFWTIQAKEQYLGLLTQLKEAGAGAAAMALDDQIQKLETRLSIFPNSCPASYKNPDFRRCVISKQTSVIIEVKGPIVFIVAVLNNKGRQTV
jgi:hypothetical protein